MTGVSSRKRFKQYLSTRRDKPVSPGHGQPAPAQESSSQRSFATLFMAFVGLLRGFRATLVLALLSLTILGLLITGLLTGCASFSRTAQEISHKNNAILKSDLQMAVDDLDAFLLADRRSRLSRWH